MRVLELMRAGSLSIGIPSWFHLILNYLRDGRCVMPTDEAALREILYEADFYQVRIDASAQLMMPCNSP